MSWLRKLIILYGVIETAGRAWLVLCWTYVVLCLLLQDWASLPAVLPPVFMGLAITVAAQWGEQKLIALEREDAEASRERAQ